MEVNLKFIKTRNAFKKQPKKIRQTASSIPRFSSRVKSSRAVNLEVIVVFLERL